MRAIGVSSIALATMVLTATAVRSANNNNWCAIYTKPENENCTFATFEQCQAQDERLDRHPLSQQGGAVCTGPS